VLKEDIFFSIGEIKLSPSKVFFSAVALTATFAVFLFAGKITYNTFKPIPQDQKSIAESKLPKAALLWSRGKMIMISMLEPWNPAPATEGENPRWSPDGSSVVFTRGNDVWIMDRDFHNQRLLFQDVVTEGGAGAFWTRDGNGLTAINRKNPRQVVLYSMLTRETTVVHDEGTPPFHNYRLSQNAELRIGNRYLLTFTVDEGHHSVIIDLKEKTYIANSSMMAGDCNPSWAPDGKFFVTTRRAWERPIYITDFSEAGGTGTVGQSRYLIGLGRSHWPVVSNDSRYVLYSDHTNIYIWQVDRQVEDKRHGVPLIRNPSGDVSPSIHIFHEAK
jgi:Tol biopolymer transport system component